MKAPSANRPDGHLVAVLGHRPPELGGYEPNFLQAAVQRRLGDILDAQRQLDEDLVLLTGLQLGAEQLAAEAAVDRGIPFVVVQPFPDPDSKWPSSSRHGVPAAARPAPATVVLLQKKAVRSPGDVRRAMGQRDAWLTRVGRRRHRRLGRPGPAPGQGRSRPWRSEVGDEVWIIDPAELA